jgi:hypothetical protein
MIMMIIAPTYLTFATIEYFFPQKTKKIMDIVTAKSVSGLKYLYTNSSHYISYIYNEYKNILLSNDKSLSLSLHDVIRIIYEGEEIAVYTLDEFILNKHKGNIEFIYDFILYEVPANNNIYDNDVYDKYVFRYENINDILSLEYNNQKGIDFTNIQISINGSSTIHKIELGMSQYMVNGNIMFDRAFIKWYLKQNHNIILDNSDKYLITFMDHTMKFITLPEYCYLIIKYDKYDIINIVDDM